MDIRRWLYYIFLKCVIVQYLIAKTVSLNELIAAEARAKPGSLSHNVQPSKLSDFKAKTVSLNELIAAEVHAKKPALVHNPSKLSDRPSQQTSINETGAFSRARIRPLKLSKSKLTGFLKRLPLFKHLASNPRISSLRRDRATITQGVFGKKKLSSLRSKKDFQIRSPLKPKRLLFAHNARQKLKNQSKKREISGNEHLKRKYIPLLKRVNMLFSNIIDFDTSDTNEIKTKNYKRNRFYSGELFPDNDSRKSGSDVSKFKSQEETNTASPHISIEASSDPKNLTTCKDYDYSIDRSDQSLPVLLPRNTISSGRDHNGSSKRSRPSYNRNAERNITWYHGTNEYNTGFRKNKTYAAGNENYTNRNSRNDTSSFEYSRTGRDRHYTENSTNGETAIFAGAKDESTTESFRPKNDFETGGNKTESKKSVREPVRRFRGYVSKGHHPPDERLPAETIQHEEVHEESIIDTTNNITRHKRISSKNGLIATKSEKIRSRNETLIFIENHYPQTENYMANLDKKAPVVLIIDGYSVTRNKNGEKEVLEKTVHIHS